MNRKRLQQMILGSAGAVVLAGGALLVTAEYQAGRDFVPMESDRALNVNQVVFPEEEKHSPDIDEDKKDDSELWEKDQNADESEHPQQNSAADYLFESSQALNGVQNATVNGATTASTGSVTAGGSANLVYDLVGDGSKADVILNSGDRAGLTTDEAGDKANGTSGGNTQNEGGTNNGNGTANTPVTPVPTPDPGKPTTPTTADRVKDPEIVKPEPGFGQLVFNEEQIKDKDVYFVLSEGGLQSFYAGQTLTARDIYRMMDAYFMTMDCEYYYLTDSDYNNYIAIDEVSFDGGVTWTKDFPVTLPGGLGSLDFVIKYRYRLSTKTDWSEPEQTFASVKDSRVMVLNDRLADDVTQISEDQILNTYNQYGSLGQLLPLMQYQDKLLAAQGKVAEDNTLTALFPGWSENGERVPWFYEITEGRHILEPLPTVPLDTSLYQVEWVERFVAPDGGVYTRDEMMAGMAPLNAEYAPLQTLTHYKGTTTYDEDYNDYLETLTVPEAVQAVIMMYQPCLAVGTLQLPDSVLYVDTSGLDPFAALDYSTGLMVKDAYEVSENNPRYTAKDGLLYNKEETVIEGVPVNRTELYIPFGTAKVNLPYGSHLQTVTLELFDAEFLPTIDYSRLPSDCQVEVEDNLLDSYLRAAAGDLRSTNVHVSSIEDPSHSYVVRDDVAINDDGILHLVLTDARRWVSLPDYVHGLGDSGLQDSGIVTLMLPQDGSNFTFEDNCFAGADDLCVIGCYSPAQLAAAKAAVAAAGLQDTIEVVQMFDEETVGDWAYLEAEDGILLLKAPKDLTEFDGYIPLENGQKLPVTAIADGVFENSENLEWVTLPDETTAIGYQAFKDCTSLQGVVIGESSASKSITIGRQAFDGCTSLRFVASNARNGNIECSDFALQDSNFIINNKYTSFLLCLVKNSYNDNWNHFSQDDNITAYRLVDCGGTKVLYGETDGNAWLALRSGSIVNGDVRLPSTTEAIYQTAFADARSGDGNAFAVDWSNLNNGLGVISVGAFFNSDVGENVVLPEDVAAGDYAFDGCQKLQSIAFPGEEVYLYRNVVTSCQNLQKVAFGNTAYNANLMTDSFYGCDNLQEIEFTGKNPPQLVLADGHYDYIFNSNWWTEEVEAEHLHLTVPEEYREDYIEAWRTAILGYPDTENSSGYQDLWKGVRTDLINQNGVVPTDEEIHAEVDARLLRAENRLRRLMGMELVTEIGHRYSYTINSDGEVTLTSARGIVYTELTSAELELPEGTGLSYIGTLAFADSPDLNTVFLPEELKGIWSDAFKGVKFDEDDPTDGLMLVRSGETVPALRLVNERVPFSFGVPDSRVEVVDLHAGSMDYDAYIQAWTLPMAGYSSWENLYNAVVRKLTVGSTAPSEEAVQKELETRLRTAENRVRSILSGCEQLAESDSITFRIPEQEIAALSLDERMATPETAALPVETTPAPTDAPADTLPEEAEKANDADGSKDEADTTADAAATPETAQAG